LVWKTTALSGLVLAAVMLWQETDTWMATIYNNVSLDVHRHVGTYRNLEDCRAGARSALERLGWGAAGAYQCGMNCVSWGDLDFDLVECEAILE
jgi:hypothetical protein